jgi:hypothetical protein
MAMAAARSAGDRVCRRWLALCVLAVTCGSMSAARAGSLADEIAGLDVLFGAEVRQTAAVAAVEIQRHATRTADFLTTATAPTFVYEYDLETGAPTRISFSGAPLFVEPGYTLGAGQWDLAVSYQYYDFDELDGDPIGDRFDEIRVEGDVGFAVETQRFSLQSHVISASLTYGVADRLDLNLVAPLVVTRLRLHAVQAGFVSGAIAAEELDTDEERAGPGDVLVRAKLRLTPPGRLNAASLLTIRTPTGSEEDFQGLGDVVVTPSLAGSYQIGRVELDANVGIDANADDLERSRVRYGVGSSLRIMDRLGLVAALIGSAGFSRDHFSEGGVRGAVPRTVILDAAAGVKVAIFRRLVAHASLAIPLTDDGLRSELVPSGGLEMTW